MNKLCVLLLIVLATGCAAPKLCGFKREDIERSFVRLSGYVERAPVPCESVVFLESPPTDRRYREIGLITPRGKKQKTFSDAVRAAQAAASLHGADAVMLLSEGGAQDRQLFGKKDYVAVRLKAIVYETPASATSQ